MSSKTHVVTSVITLGRVSLYEPTAYKAKKADKPNKPRFVVNLALDKETDVDLIDKIEAAQQAAIDEAIENGEWDEDLPGILAFKDADTTKVQESQTSKRKIILSVKRPELKGKYSLQAKASAARPPVVKYLDPKTGRQIMMPKPILNPDPDDTERMAEAARRKEFWDEMVFAGQYAIVSITFRAWVSELGQGTSAVLDNVLIMGGGTPTGSVAWEEDFSDDMAAQLKAWAASHLPSDYELPENPWDKSGVETTKTLPRRKTRPTVDDELVDEDTGEIEEKPRRTRRVKPVDTEDDVMVEPKIQRRRTRRTPVEEEEEIEETPAPRRRRKTTPVVEEDYADEEDVF